MAVVAVTAGATMAAGVAEEVIGAMTTAAAVIAGAMAAMTMVGAAAIDGATQKTACPAEKCSAEDIELGAAVIGGDTTTAAMEAATGEIKS
jgi:hypothetical protein